MVVLKIGKDSIHQGSSGQITGEIYFEMNKQYFPFKNWNDFPVNIIQWWSDEFMECVENGRNSFEFLFMDGPYKIYAERKGTRTFDIYFLDSREDPVIIFREIRDEEIADCLMEGYRRIIEYLKEKNISSRIVSILKERLSELELWLVHSGQQEANR